MKMTTPPNEESTTYGPFSRETAIFRQRREKRSLSPTMEGRMIDIHSHIIWGVDDGARNREESIAMLRVAAETGTTDIVATPHFDRQSVTGHALSPRDSHALSR
jgi:hypothetical protein